MPLDYNFTVSERLMRYVQIDTQSDPNSQSHPSTEKQKTLSALLAAELLAMGIVDAHTDEYGYVYATIPANSPKNIPTICFCAHVDTAPDCSGTDVKPILHKYYNGVDIVLPDDQNQVITTNKYPYLLKHLNSDIITASGKTLLGGDDKAGVSIIMDLANYLAQHPEILHGTIRILFTPDEEVGRGTDKLDMKKLAADFGYTLDGGAYGDFEDETFSADAAIITIQGVIAHPGDGKNKLVNALKIGGEILAALPKDSWSPETTEGREGFVHPVSFEGGSEKAILEFIVRDFDSNKLVDYEQRLKGIAETVLLKHPKASMQFEVKEQYRNMKEVLDNHPQVSAYAKEAYDRLGISMHKTPIRGGTDGSRLSFIGLPCANIFTGMQAIHSKHEWIGVKDMEQAVNVLVELVQVWELHA
ncbi:MAG: peptidase T [Bacteroidetes bacterium]|nr:peptidase T [Bacteroidota bacterium]